MAESYFLENSIYGKDYVVNNYRCKRIKDKFLLTTDHGGWAALTREEMGELHRGNPKQELFKMLWEKGIILTSNSEGLVLDLMKKRYSYLFSGVSLHIILPTLRCNHRCVYCHSAAKKANEKEYDMDEETMKKTVDFMLQCPSRYITIEFQGGETLLNKEMFKKTVLYAEKQNRIFKKNIRFCIATNLVLMDDETIDFIKKHKVDVSTSVDGPMEVHDAARKYIDGSGTYKEVFEKYMDISSKGVNVGTLMVTTKQSLNKWKEIIDEYVKLGCNEIQVKYINKLGFADDEWEKIGYSIEEFMEFWKKCVEYIIELNKKGIKIRPRMAKVALQKILLPYDPGFLDLRSPCGIGIGQLAYNVNGDIFSCDEGRSDGMFKLGNVKTHTYKEVIESEKCKSLVSCSINDNFLCDACAYKPYCGLCPIIAYSENSNIITKLWKSSKCKHNKMIFDFVFEKMLFDKEAREIFFEWATDWSSAKEEEKNNVDFTFKKIEEEYPIGRVVDIERNFATLNKTFKIKTDKGVYFAKIIDMTEDNRERLRKREKIIGYLEDSRLCVPFIKNKEGKQVLDLGEWAVVLQEYIENEGYGFSKEELRSAGEILAKYHKAISGLGESKTDVTEKRLDNAYRCALMVDKLSEGDLKYLGIDDKAGFKEKIKKAYDSARRIFEKENYNAIEKTFLHGDFRPLNILFKGKKARKLIDFESMKYAPRILDIGRVQTLFRLHPFTDKMNIEEVDIKAFLEGYNSVLKLSERETALLNNAVMVSIIYQVGDWMLTYLEKKDQEWLRKLKKKLLLLDFLLKNDIC
jgi:His-Xaa-Ser system radical SAM maturase HxsB